MIVINVYPEYGGELFKASSQCSQSSVHDAVLFAHTTNRYIESLTIDYSYSIVKGRCNAAVKYDYFKDRASADNYIQHQLAKARFLCVNPINYC